MAGAAVKMLRTDMGHHELKPQFRRYFNEDRKDWPEIYSQYFKKETTDEAYEEYMEFGDFPNFPKKDEGDYINFAVPPVGNRVRLQPDTYQLAFAITYEDRRQNRVNKVNRAIASMARARRRTVETVAAQPLNLGFSSTYHGNDNKPLFATDHPTLAGGTAANRPASDVDLTQTTLEAAVTSFMTMTDMSGFPIQMMPRYLVVHPSNLINAQRILEASNRFIETAGVPSGADTGVFNILKRYNIVPIANPYLTDPDAWFLLADKDQHEVIVLWGEMPKDRTFTDNFTEDYVYSVRFMLVPGFLTWLGTYGTTGAG